MRSPLVVLAIVATASSANADSDVCLPKGNFWGVEAHAQGRQVKLCVGVGEDPPKTTCRLFDPGTKRFAAASPSVPEVRLEAKGKQVKICERGRPCREIALVAAVSEQSTQPVALSADREHLAVIAGDPAEDGLRLDVYSVRSKRRLRSRELECGVDVLTCDAISWLDNRRLLGVALDAGGSGTAMIINARTAKRVQLAGRRTRSEEDDTGLNAVYLDKYRLAGARWIFIDGNDAVVQDIRTGKVRRSIDLKFMPGFEAYSSGPEMQRPKFVRLRGWRFAAVYGPQQSPDGKVLDGRVVVVDLRRRKVLSNTAIPRCGQP